MTCHGLRVAVYCSARDIVVTPELVSLTEELGGFIASTGDLVYGGGNSGLMAHIARGVAKFNGRVFGVITHNLVELEGVSVHVTDLIVKKTMSERKDTMRDMSDLAVVLPGGAGTLDEMFDYIVHSQLNEHKDNKHKPLFVYGKGEFGQTVRNLLDALITNKLIKDYEEINVMFFESVSDLDEILGLGITRASTY